MNREQGQATVELALLLPFLAGLVLVVAQVAVVLRDRVALTHVARVATRVAVVDPDPAVVRAAAARAGLDGRRVRVEVRTRGEEVEVLVRYRAPTDVPLVGALVPDVTWEERLVGRIER